MQEIKPIHKNILLIKRRTNKKQFPNTQGSDLKRLRKKEIILWHLLILSFALFWVYGTLSPEFKWLWIVLGLYTSVTCFTMYYIMQISKIIFVFYTTSIKTFEELLLYLEKTDNFQTKHREEIVQIKKEILKKQSKMKNKNISEESDFQILKQFESAFYTVWLLCVSMLSGIWFRLQQISTKMITLIVLCGIFGISLIFYKKIVRLISIFEKTAIQNYNDLLLYLQNQENNRENKGVANENH